MNRAEAIWERAFGWRRMYEARQTVNRFLPELRQATSVLDLGSGRGYIARVLEEELDFDVVCCDVVESAIHPFDRYCLFNGSDLPFRDATFDAVLIAFVLHHAEDPLHLLHEVQRVCTGSILIVEDTPSAWLDHAWGEIHIRSFNKRNGIEWQGEVRREEEWEQLFARAGLRVRRDEALGRWERLPPVKRTAFVLEAA